MISLSLAVLMLMLGAAAVLGIVVRMLWEFIRISSRDPLTLEPPNDRSARARRMAGVYVRRRTGTDDTVPRR